MKRWKFVSLKILINTTRYFFKHSFVKMSKKSVRFDKKDANDEFEDYGALLGDKTSKNKSRRFKEKHSLDSDEEDAEEETQLDEDEIEGN